MSDDNPQQMGDFLAGFQARIAEKCRRNFLAGTWSKCPALTEPENACQTGEHAIGRDLGEGQYPEFTKTRDCPIETEKKARAAHARILNRCPLVQTVAERYGLTEWSTETPLWQQLLAKVDRRRPVVGDINERKYDLAQLVGLIEKGCRQPSVKAPHVLLSGPCGTGKTTLQAVMYLASAEAGIDADFVDSIDLRSLAGNLTSRWDETARKAESDMALLVRRQVLFWSDAGDSAATVKAFPETIAAILERFTGRIVVSTNLSLPELAKHPDFTQRIVSRMTATRHERPAIVVLLDGTDQRKHRSARTEVSEL